LYDFTLLSPATYSVESLSQDPRLGQLIQPYSAANVEAADVVIFGVPTDEGIARNGGRIGASEAPAAIRTALQKLTPFAGPNFKHHIESISIVDIGDIRHGTLDGMHDEARTIIRELASMGKIVIALGGGHDVTYPLVKGLGEAPDSKPLGLINVDAHLDVRPLIEGKHHSGSSFRLLIEEGVIFGSRLCEIGIQPFVNAQTYFDWAIGQGARVLTFEDATTSHLPNAFEECAFVLTLGDDSTPLYLSFDMDAVRAADAPGVSAPAAVGFLAEEAFELAVAAGLNRSVKAFDLVEVSPKFDIDGRTARLAARMIAGFLAGVANRNV
jgi:formiminoglutamase